MKKKIIPGMIIVIAVLLLTILNGCTEKKVHDEDHLRDSEMNETNNLADSSLIRGDGFMVKAVDENGDGKVYQCPMDYEVIADKNANCPICKMELEEYPVEKAQMNFDKYMNL